MDRNTSAFEPELERQKKGLRACTLYNERPYDTGRAGGVTSEDAGRVCCNPPAARTVEDGRAWTMFEQGVSLVAAAHIATASSIALAIIP